MNKEDVETSQQILATFQQLMPVLDKDLQLLPNPRQQKRQKADAKDQKRPRSKSTQEGDANDQVLRLLQQLTSLVVRHDQELNLQRRSDSFVMFFSNQPEGVLALLIKETLKWKNLEVNPASTVPKLPLRQHLMKSMLKELLDRVDRIAQAKEQDKFHLASIKNGLILPDKSWPYHQWNPSTRALEHSRRQPISMGKMMEHIQELQEMILEPSLILRFSALRAPGESPVTPWRLQLNPRSDIPHALFTQLCNNMVWTLLGTNLKMHTLHQSNLASSLQEQIGKRPGKGRGKGTAKGQTKQEI